MFTRIATAAVLVSAIAIAAPAPASAGLFTNLVGHVAKQIAKTVVKKAEKVVVHAVDRKIQVAFHDKDQRKGSRGSSENWR